MTTLNPAIVILMEFAGEHLERYEAEHGGIDLELLCDVVNTVQSALTLALVDPGWALRVTRLVMRTVAADTGIPHVVAMLNEWDSARAFIAAHPLAEG